MIKRYSFRTDDDGNLHEYALSEGQFCYFRDVEPLLKELQDLRRFFKDYGFNEIDEAKRVQYEYQSKLEIAKENYDTLKEDYEELESVLKAFESGMPSPAQMEEVISILEHMVSSESPKVESALAAVKWLRKIAEVAK